MVLEKIFFSYSRADGSAFALKLALDLKKEGFNVWIDQEDIRAGSEWDLEIEKALETCDCLLFIETAKSVTSNNVLDEVYYALEEKKKVIPLILVDSKTPFRLQRLQHIDFTRNYHSGLGLLINELRDTTAAESFGPAETKPLVTTAEPFYKKYAGLALIIASFLIIIATALFYTLSKKKPVANENEVMVNLNDSSKEGNRSVAIEPKETSENDVSSNEEKKVTTANNNKKANNKGNEIVSKPGNKTVYSPEDVAGDWKLMSVEPKAESVKGYLKVEAMDEKKVGIKTFMQFYYFKTNDTAFLSVFNAFAGCNSCILSTDMKLAAEDVAIGSHIYKILKQDAPGDGKAGDTVLNAGSNKSIRASVTLHILDNKTAIIKVQQPASTELSHGMILKPFVYSFRFSKLD